jgi:hypothetical protein
MLSLELTAQIIFPCLLFSRRPITDEWMNEWMNECVIAYLLPAQKVWVTLASSYNQLFSNLRQSTESQDSSTILSPKFSCTKQQKHVNKLKYSLPRKSY